MKMIHLLASLALMLLIGNSQAQTTKLEEQTGNSQNRVLFVLTSHDQMGATEKKTGYWLSEVSHPWKVLTDAGYQIDFVSPEGGKAPADPRSIDKDDPINVAFLNSADYKEKVSNTLTPGAIDPQDYAALFYAGGHGTMWDLPGNAALASLTANIYENQGVVGAVCHGPAGLVNVQLTNGNYLVDGKTVSAFTNEEERASGLDMVVPFLLEDRLKARGATIKKAGLWEQQIAVDGRLITGQNPKSATAVGKALLKALDE